MFKKGLWLKKFSYLLMLLVIANFIFVRSGTTIQVKASDLVVDPVETVKGRFVNVKDFGAVGDYVTDDTMAIQAANDYCKANNFTLFFPSGVYALSNGITKKCSWVGEGTPALGTFPLTDDKLLLREGKKTSLPGSVLIFKGTGTNSVTTQRTDEFSQVTYCVKTEPGASTDMDKIAIVQDMIAVDAAGKWTTPENDQRANYDVGYMIDDSFRNTHSDFVVFGYFNKAGIWIHGTENKTHLGDPDYNSFTRGSTSGNIGLAITGSQVNDDHDGGLSGTRFSDFNIFSKDHHSRSKTNDDWGKACIYIDGYTAAKRSGINGHYFSQCGVRTYGNNPLIFGTSNNISFVQTVFETPKYNTPNSKATQFLASESTLNVSFINCRFSDGAGLDNEFFGKKIKERLLVIGEPYNDITISEKGTAVRIGLQNEKPFLQFTNNNLLSRSNGIKIESNMDGLSFLKDNKEFFNIKGDGSISKNGYGFGGTKLIENNSITIDNYGYYSVDYSGTDSDLSTINGATFVGQRLVLKSTAAERGFTLIKSAGNIKMRTNLKLDSVYDRVELEWDGQFWVLISFSDND